MNVKKWIYGLVVILFFSVSSHAEKNHFFGKEEVILQQAGNWQKILAKLDNLELPNLKSKLNSFDEVAKTRFADDVANLSDDALKQLEDNFGLLDEWKQTTCT
jgi:hypothetical protein